jgi:phospholipid/cholesterol/gamma-HCH transport system ATP-binding protein
MTMNDARPDSTLLRVAGLDYADTDIDLNCVIEPGEMLIIRTPRDDQHLLLIHQLLGLEETLAGKIRLFGKEFPARGSKEMSALRSRIGVVFARSGLISNLKVLENLLLPVQYHKLPLAGPAEELALAALERVGYHGAPMALPGLLSSFERKQVVLARAMLCDPDLMIYDALFNGLNEGERGRFLALVHEIHGEKAGRASLFLSADPLLATFLPAANRVNLVKGVTE